MNKIQTTIGTGLAGLVLSLGAMSCDGDDGKKVCGALNVSGGRYQNATYSSAAYNANGTISAEPTCRESCEYKPSVGCCWCPD